MTGTAKELLTDKNFLQGRIKEQIDYQEELMDRYINKEIDWDRYEFLWNSAEEVKSYFFYTLCVLKIDE